MNIFNTIGQEELAVAKRVIERGFLSGYIGSDPYGGPEVSRLERDWKKTFEVKHAVAVNSATSGLLAACMAIGISHDDEVIVSPYTMSATAAAPKILGAKLVWADIERESYTIDPVEVSNKITRKTKAVIATNLFGHPAHLSELRDICDGLGVWLIEDNAQAIFARESNNFCGTIGHMGIFSLNVHKQLQVGEGGIVVTNSSELDKKLRETMNHGEMRGGIAGLNLRMTEIVAAMAIEQLKKADQIMASRRLLWQKIGLQIVEQNLPIIIPYIRYGCEHACYAWAGQLQKTPKKPISAPFKEGYMRPLYELPSLQERTDCSRWVVDDVEDRMVLFEVCAYDPTDDEIKDMVKKLGDAL